VAALCAGVGARGGELLELAGLEAGGLGVLADGTLIRALEVGAVNPLLRDEETVAQLSERFHRLLARIPGARVAGVLCDQPAAGCAGIV
jgi:hypothetical protein